MRWRWSLMAAALAACSGAAEPPHGEHEEHEEHEGDVVELTAEAVASARIVVSAAEVGTMSRVLTVPARVALDPTREALVSSWVSGQVGALRVRPGDAVKARQRLAEVQTPNLGEAVAAWRAAKALDDAADARLDRLRFLEKEGVTSRSQVLEAEAEHAAAVGALEAAEERLRILGVDPTIGDPHAGEHFPSVVPVVSPIAGKILTIDASVGERVEPGQTLFHIGALDEVQLILDIYERDLSAVQVGQDVRFTVEAWPTDTFQGTVAQVGDWLHPDARTVEVRVVVTNPDRKLKPNMFAQAELAVSSADGPSGIVLPMAAVQRMDGVDVVFIEAEPRHFMKVPVTVAARTTSQVRLSSGVDVGQRVVLDGAFALKSELEKSELGEGHAH